MRMDSNLEGASFFKIFKLNLKELPFIIVGFLAALLQGATWPACAIAYNYVLEVCSCSIIVHLELLLFLLKRSMDISFFYVLRSILFVMHIIIHIPKIFSMFSQKSIGQKYLSK